jgi:signal transduction histidine kinase
MIAKERLAARCVWRQAVFSLLSSALLAWAVPALLLLSNPVRSETSSTLFVSLLIGGIAALGVSWTLLKRHRFLLRAMGVDQFAAGSEAVEQKSFESFIGEPYRLTFAWLLPKSLAVLVFVSPLRPAPMNETTGTTVALLSVLTLATLSLPLHALVRRDFLDVIELIPRSSMQKLLETAQLSGAMATRIQRRLVVAVTTPVVFVAMGCALIVNAHLRHAEESSRRETARVLARAAFELEPGHVEGLKRAIDRARQLGFPAQIEAERERYGLILDKDGVVELTTPLDSGSARVRFNASTITVLSPAPVMVALLATVVAGLLALLLGTLLITDLNRATRGLRLLMTNPTAAGDPAQLPGARVRPVAQLFHAIRGLADRFVMFAQAQENAIDARARATRMRGLFFASVSHDLKGPLNSILGFTQLVTAEPLAQGQRESLHTVHSRAQELLALIETILDAARVEEGHLSLMTEEVAFGTLYEAAVSKAGQLCSDAGVQIYDEIERNLPPLLIDRIRVLRAMATLIAYSVRSNPDGRMWVRAERESRNRMRIDIDVPKPQHAPTEIEAMLAPTLQSGRREHRGLALGLRLARSVVELHQGTVRVIDRGKKGAMFCVSLPTVDTPMPTASAPHHTLPSDSSRPPPPPDPPKDAPSLPEGDESE